MSQSYPRAIKLVTTFILGITAHVVLGQSLTWTERQPAGDVDVSWRRVTSSADGTKLMAAANNGRLYTSSDSGANWTERQPAGDADKYWSGLAVSSNGATLIASAWGGRLYTSTNSGASVVIHSVCILSSTARARRTFSRIASALAVHLNALGSSLCSSM